MYTYHDLFRSLREGKFTSFGCYPKFFVTSNGTVLSHEAVRENLWDVARATRDLSYDGIIGEDVNWEDPDLRCDHTEDRIESAYAEEGTP